MHMHKRHPNQWEQSKTSRRIVPQELFAVKCDDNSSCFCLCRGLAAPNGKAQGLSPAGRTFPWCFLPAVYNYTAVKDPEPCALPRAILCVWEFKWRLRKHIMSRNVSPGLEGILILNLGYRNALGTTQRVRTELIEWTHSSSWTSLGRHNMCRCHSLFLMKIIAPQPAGLFSLKWLFLWFTMSVYSLLAPFTNIFLTPPSFPLPSWPGNGPRLFQLTQSEQRWAAAKSPVLG